MEADTEQEDEELEQEEKADRLEQVSTVRQEGTPSGSLDPGHHGVLPRAVRRSLERQLRRAHRLMSEGDRLRLLEAQ